MQNAEKLTWEQVKNVKAQDIELLETLISDAPKFQRLLITLLVNHLRQENEQGNSLDDDLINDVNAIDFLICFLDPFVKQAQ